MPKGNELRDQFSGNNDSVREGAELYNYIMNVDANKSDIGMPNTTLMLNDIFSTFCRNTNSDLNVEVNFSDVHKMIGHYWHTELSYVTINNRDIILHFHPNIFSFSGPSSGLIFCAKCWPLILIISRMIEKFGGITKEFVFEIGDNATLGQVSFTSTNENGCLIVDFDFAASGGYKSFRDLCCENIPAWSERRKQVFWRGATTGQRSFTPQIDATEQDLCWLPRLALCDRIRRSEFAEMCDVGISNIVQISEPHLFAAIQSSGLMKDRVPREEFLKYRGAIDIDGNANAWSGLFCSLLGNSCVLKVGSPTGHRQWYYDRLIPWLNYIPIASDLSDLEIALSWFDRNQSHAEQIANRGRELAGSITYASAIEESAEALFKWLIMRPK